MSHSKNQSDFINLLFLLVTLGLFAYGIIIPWLGFYYDDWAFAWIAYRLGPLELFESFRPFRPFLGPYFLVTASIIPQFPWMWHSFNFLVRMLLSLSCFWMLNQIWPEQKKNAFWVSLFFFLYPGFNQQWVSMTHSNQGLLPHLFQLLSFGLMVKALRAPLKTSKWFTLSLVTGFIGIFSTEYFITLELLRPIFIWIILERNQNNRINLFVETMKKWAPYLCILILNIIWLSLYQSSSAYDSYRVSVLKQLFNNPVLFFQINITEFIQSFLLTAIEVWLRLFEQLKNPLNAISTYLSLTITILVLVFLYLTMTKWKKLTQFSDYSYMVPSQEDSWAKQALFIGGLGIILGKLPSWSIGLPLASEFPHDRLMMSVMFAASLFIVGLIDYLVVKGGRKTFLLILITAFAVGHHFSTGNTYRRDWDMQKDFFQQLIWRAPNLKKGTILLTHELPHKYVTDNSLSAALNWVYEPDNHSRDISYMLAYTKARLGGDLLPALEFDTPINYMYRTMNFSSSVNQSLVIYYPTDSCLRVLDPMYTNKEFFPEAPYMLTDAIFLSDITNIIDENMPAQLPVFFGQEDQNNWCYFFQKAELARQYESWEEIIKLYEIAEDHGLKSRNSSEYLVFIEAFIQSGNLLEAHKIIQEKLIVEGIPVDGTCYTLSRIMASVEDVEKTAIREIIQTSGCSL